MELVLKGNPEHSALLLRAIERLTRRGDVSVVRCLRLAPKQKDTLSRLAYIAVLRKTECLEAEPLLKPLLRDSQVDVRYSAFKALEMLASEKRGSAHWIRLLKLKSDATAAQVENAKRILSCFDLATLKALNDKPEDGRRLCCVVLRSDDAKKRRLGLLGLGQFGDRSCINEILTCMKNNQAPDELALALSVLERFADGRDVPLGPYLVPFCKHSEPLVRAAAIRVMGSIKEQRALPLIQVLSARDMDVHVRATASQVLRVIKKPKRLNGKTPKQTGDQKKEIGQYPPLTQELNRLSSEVTDNVMTSIKEHGIQDKSAKNACQRIVGAHKQVMSVLARTTGITVEIASHTELVCSVLEQIEKLHTKDPVSCVAVRSQVECLARRGIVLFPLAMLNRSVAIPEASLMQATKELSETVR